MLEATQTKLEEAKFFYGHLVNEQNRPPTNLALSQAQPKVFLFYLSAFISAARSIPWVMQNEQREKYDKWLPTWERTRTEEDLDLLQLTNDVRQMSSNERALRRKANGA